MSLSSVSSAASSASSAGSAPGVSRDRLPKIFDSVSRLAGDLDGAEHRALEIGRLELELEGCGRVVHRQGAAAEIDDLEVLGPGEHGDHAVDLLGEGDRVGAGRHQRTDPRRVPGFGRPGIGVDGQRRRVAQIPGDPVQTLGPGSRHPLDDVDRRRR